MHLRPVQDLPIGASPAPESPVPELLALQFTGVIRRIMARDCTAMDLIAAAESLAALGAADLVCQIYRSWIEHNPDDALLAAMQFNLGTVLSAMGNHPAAKQAFLAAIARNPDFLPPHINLGTILEREGDPQQAIACWMQVANRLGAVNGESIYHRTTALKQIGRVLEAARQPANAENALRECLEINPHQRDVMQHWIALRQVQCTWPLIVPWKNISADALLGAISPLSLAAYSDDPIFQLANAHRYYTQDVAERDGIVTLGQWPPPEAPKHRLRIGYVSSDLRAHAVGFLTSDIFGLHDRTRVEVFAYYCGPAVTDETQARIKSSVDHWRDITALTDKQAAQIVIADEIDILVDVNGYTKDARTKLFALRPAPVIVNWLGYPGSTGGPHHHYIIADDTIIPPTHEKYYSERVLRLPCYQPNDRHRVIAPHPPTRAELGLPDAAFVYCCFNGTQKITAATFGTWMEILRATPHGVLWLLSGGAESDARLRARAVAAGVMADRLIFSPFMLNPAHLARYRRADLFLDTAPYGAHTTASDALWMGVPVLTVLGQSFPARVCASLVRNAGLGDLVCADAAGYRDLAIALARDPARLQSARDTLARERGQCALFDTPKLVRALEKLYASMWRDHMDNKLPRPDLTNLPLYHDIARTRDGTAEKVNDADYLRALTSLDRVAPVPPDNRLWPSGPIQTLGIQASGESARQITGARAGQAP